MPIWPRRRKAPSPVSSPEAARGHESSAPSILGSRSGFRGGVRGRGDLVVRGSLEGRISISGSLEVPSGGLVGPEVEVRELRVQGRAAGQLRVVGLLRAREGSELSGTLTAGRWVVSDGARVNGTIRPSPKSSKK